MTSIYSQVLQKACAPISQAATAHCACIPSFIMEIGNRTCHITTNFSEQIDESVSGVMRVVTLVKPHNNKMETTFTKDNM